MHIGEKAKPFIWQREGKGPGDRPPLKIERFKNMSLIFKTESILNPRLSFSPSSQHSCFSLLPNAHKSLPDGNSQRPLQSHRGHSGEGRGRNSCAQSLPGPRAPGSSSASCGCRLAPFSWARPTPLPLCSHCAAPPPSPSLWSRFEAIQSYAVHQMCLLFS